MGSHPERENAGMRVQSPAVTQAQGEAASPGAPQRQHSRVLQRLHRAQQLPLTDARPHRDGGAGGGGGWRERLSGAQGHDVDGGLAGPQRGRHLR